MTKLPVAIQLYSVRDDLKRDFEGTLKKIKAMGYDGVEFAGLYGYSYEEVRELCKKVGLIPVSAHVSISELSEKTKEVVEGFNTIGCPLVTIPSCPVDYRPDGAKYGEFLDIVKRIAKLCRENGMALAYHNHDFEFEKKDGKYLLDIMYGDLSGDELGAQLDVCWVNVGGENPCRYIAKYAEREFTLHLKDFAGKKGGKMYALIGVDEVSQADEKCNGEFTFMPIGSGVQNLPAIIEAAEKTDIKWLIVEQDFPTAGMTAMECAEKSIKYLKSL